MREKLIELIGTTEYGNGSLIGKNFQKGFIEKIADHLIANGATVQRWIPVTERLPEKDGTFLVRWENKSVSDADYEGIYGSFGFWLDFWLDKEAEWVAHDGITHYMPLPEAPKGE